MNRRWASYHGMQRGDQTLANLGQGHLHSGVPGSPFSYGARVTSEEVMSIPPALIFGGNHPTTRTMPSRGKASKVKKTDTAPRRDSRHSEVSSTVHEHVETLGQRPSNDTHAKDAAHLGHSSIADATSQLDDSVQLTDTGVLSNSTTSSIATLQQALVADREGFRLDRHYLSESHHTPSPGPTENANVVEKPNYHVPSRTGADVAMDAYGDTLKIDSALCKKLAGEVARREPTQRRSDQKLNIERRSNVEALLAHVTGGVAARPCKNCHKGHGPWTECVVGSRCTFHENNNPQPPRFASPAAAPTPTLVAQPVATYQHLSTAATPPAMSLQSDILQWALADETRQFLSQTMGDIVSLTKRGRYIARIEAAAKELGMRIAEYDEYLRTPDGIAEQQRLEQDQLSQNQMGDVPMDDNSPGAPLT
ncbi:hypothetical protein ED733_003875 [Metarhizium rileyi]|uniref:Uncharacterized protein n=1 Tax=Metarhizium rileyi (strain RCEF 4871) TaxID=1649241 RepID=A0A5C6G524_METRR|nr:hypothetical protein ED733_003875 [Metarhizium rileyi]